MPRTRLPRRFVGMPLLLALAGSAAAADGNRLTYLDGSDPYYVGRGFPRLVTPQWVGEEGVEAVVILGIDDMREPKKYETFLRPILRRLKKIDGRAPVSIMTCQVKPDDEQLQAWLKEGLSLETHTLDHPCPLLANGDFAKALRTYEGCVDLLASVPNNKPVAFRVPCCDSLNTVSPRFFAEVFNRTTAKGNFLAVDTSVFNLTTANDPELPRGLVLEDNGRERFRKYIPADRSFVNTVEDYPYPFVINRLCWEFPCAVPSDWEAQYLHKPKNPVTVRDWEALLDATVLKQGVFCLVFHPHGWIDSEQIVDLIDHAVTKHGKKVKFLTFREALERINKNLLAGQPLRHPVHGTDNGVRLLDLNNDGYLDVVIGNDKVKKTRVWSPKERRWIETAFPTQLVGTAKIDGKATMLDAGAHFGVLRPDGKASLLPCYADHVGGWHFDGNRWVEDRNLWKGVSLKLRRGAVTPWEDRARGIRLCDLDGDGVCELVVADEHDRAVYSWSATEKTWRKLPFTVPGTFSLSPLRDGGARFLDLDGAGRLDLLFSNEKEYGLYLFTDMKGGWSRKVLQGKAGDKGALPMISRNGANNGAWFHSRHLWVQNEQTSALPNLVDRRSFNQMLETVEPTAKSPEASLRCIRTRPGFTVELVAAEPLVQSPIAFAWGPDGKLWVVEMGDYPLGVDGRGKPGGRIKYLEDTKGTGKYDKATVFLDNLPFPTGVMPWRKGVIVTCAPEIFYAEDTKGTGKADLRVPLYTGFTEGNQQHRVNGLVWGLDNWAYGANGDSGGVVKSVKKKTVADLRGRDFRLRPDTGDFDLQSGQTQYGRSRDDWGDWFGNNNSWPMWHFALADHYLRRNPHVAAPDPRVQVSETPGASRVYPVSRTLPRFNDPQAANHFTSACSAIVYRDELFGPAFANSTFVSEPVHNLIHREIMRPSGTTFTSRRAADEQQSEFLASSDNWFRPTMIQTGPDGALWVADMYRAVIEHPQWIPKDWQERLDLRAGHDKGRIYRVYPVGAKPRAIPRLDRLDTAGLVAALDSPNGWQRDMAQQMLLWRQDKDAVPPLEKLATNSERPLARLHALCTLDGLDALRPALLQRALADKHPGVRRHAIRLCEGRFSKAPKLGDALLKLLPDDDPQVRLQLAYTLGEWDDPRAGEALGRLALAEQKDRFLSAAVMSSVNPRNLETVLRTVLSDESKSTLPPVLIENLLRTALAEKQTKALVTLLKLVSAPDKGKGTAWRYAVLAGVLDALDQRNASLGGLRAEGDKELKAAVEGLEGTFRAARAVLAAEDGDKEQQLLAVRLLGRGLDRKREDVELLAGLLVPQTDRDLQAAAVAALGRLTDPRIPELLLRGWKGYGPALRLQVFDALLTRNDRVAALLDALESKKVIAAELDAARRQRLLGHKDAAVRRRAAKVLADAVAPDRQKVVDAYQPVLKLQGDKGRGAKVFARTCAACHRLGDVGHAVGPDLASVGDKSPQGLMISILDPNRVVEARYINYLAVLKNGQTFSGVLAAETGTSVTLVGQDGKQQVILRTALDELVSTGKSLMPDGLEKDLTHQDLADLIAFIRGAGPAPKPKTFEGNRPQTVRPDGDGVLHLTAANGEIYGRTLVLEAKYGNLGFWQSDDDEAIWTVEVPRGGRYAVWLDWACDDAAAGKRFVLEAGTAELSGKVEGTGGWDRYRQARIGELTLSGGTQRLRLRPGQPLRSGPLIDLKAIKLTPLK